MVFNYFPFRHITDMSPTFISDIYIGITATITATLPPKQYLHRHFTPTFTPTKQQQPSAFTDQQLIWLLSQNYPKRDKNRRKGDYTLLYIGILRENDGDYIIEYQQLKSFIVQVVAISLCKLWLFHCASCGIFIVQVVAISLCKLRISHKKWCSIPQNETPLI